MLSFPGLSRLNQYMDDLQRVIFPQTDSPVTPHPGGRSSIPHAASSLSRVARERRRGKVKGGPIESHLILPDIAPGRLQGDRTPREGRTNLRIF